MQKLVNHLNKLEVWFFYGFLITFTLSVRKVLFFYSIRGQFNEYTGVYLYLSDIFLLLVLLSRGLDILHNKIINKSSTIIGYKAYLKQKIVIIPLILIILSFASVFWSINWQVAFFRSLKLLEFYLLYLWVIFRMFHVESENNERCSTWNIFSNSASIIIFTGVIQSIVGIWQFVIQKSIGLTWLKESILSPDISGVAKVVFGGEKYIRAYGLFPHPNILGGFLVLSITLTLAFLKPFNLLKNLKNSKNEENMINPSQNVPRGTFNGTNLELQKNNICSTWNIWLDYFILGIQLLALFLTFSKSAWIGVTIALAYVLIRNVPRGTLRRISEKNFKYFALIGGIIILLIFLVKPDWHSIAGKSIDDRIFYLNVSRGTFFENPVFGVGSGQFVLNLETIENIQEWQFQPVHNVFLLILNELGIIGLCLFVWFVRKMIRNVPRGTFLTNNYLSAIFFGFLFIMLFDHYFWDIQQGQIMLWFVLGLLSGGKMWTSKKFNTYPQDKAK